MIVRQGERRRTRFLPWDVAVEARCAGMYEKRAPR